MNVLIRTDSSVRIGSGHVMRTLTLADELHQRGADVTFLSRELTGNLIDYISYVKGYRVLRLKGKCENDGILSKKYGSFMENNWQGISWEEDCSETKEKIKDVLDLNDRIEWLIVDHYSLDAKWELSLREFVDKIFVIDDLANRVHDADILLDQNLHNNLEDRYEGLLPATCSKLLGPQYALLRPEFQEARKSLRKRDGRIQRILVFFGGSDLTNETMKVLTVLSKLQNEEILIDVLVGGINPHREQIINHCNKHKNIQYHINVDYVANLMAMSDLFIGSGGTSTWERCCLGLPSIIIAVANNQEELSREMAAQNLAIYLGTSRDANKKSIEKKIGHLLNSPGLVQKISDMSLNLVDGSGVKKVVSKIASNNIKLRKITKNDLEILWHWANEPAARKSAFSSTEITWETHISWFNSKLNDPNTYIFIAENSFNEPVGQIRFEDSEGFGAVIDVNIDKNQRGLGIGNLLINTAVEKIFRETPIEIVHAFIKPTNIGSIKVFEKAQFIFKTSTTIDNQKAYHYIRRKSYEK